jgi:hypothetical protein
MAGMTHGFMDMAMVIMATVLIGIHVGDGTTRGIHGVMVTAMVAGMTLGIMDTVTVIRIMEDIMVGAIHIMVAVDISHATTVLAVIVPTSVAQQVSIAVA